MADKLVLGYWGIRGLAQPSINSYNPNSQIPVGIP